MLFLKSWHAKCIYDYVAHSTFYVRTQIVVLHKPKNDAKVMVPIVYETDINCFAAYQTLDDTLSEVPARV
jgi:hypothetical protein